MKLSLNTERRSATLKVLAIGLLILALLVPVGMIKQVIYDRIQIEGVAQRDIQHSWGGMQTVAGPILRIPFKVKLSNGYGPPTVGLRFAFIVAESVSTKANVVAETRYRGIHEVPVYAAALDVRATFDFDLLGDLRLDPDSIVWEDAEIVVGVSDPAAINTVPVLSIGNANYHFVSTKKQIQGLPSQLSVRVGEQMQAWRESGVFDLQLLLSVNGSRALNFMTLAESSVVELAANWPSPSFTGRRLPMQREVTGDAFTARWQSTSLGRKLPAQWVEGEAVPNEASDGSFGVRFMQPIGLYQLMTRALKYAIMFIGLTFVTYFLMETLGKASLHPLQYLLVGLANTLFYLLLLSLSEHIGFGVAYAVSSVASAVLIVGYSAEVLPGKHRIKVMGGILAALYGFLYLTLRAESYALLAGSIGLWIVLGGVMYLTRKINWYGARDAESDV